MCWGVGTVFSGVTREGNRGPSLMIDLSCLKGRECLAETRMSREGKPLVLRLQLRQGDLEFLS